MNKRWGLGWCRQSPPSVAGSFPLESQVDVLSRQVISSGNFSFFWRQMSNDAGSWTLHRHHYHLHHTYINNTSIPTDRQTDCIQNNISVVVRDSAAKHVVPRCSGWRAWDDKQERASLCKSIEQIEFSDSFLKSVDYRTSKTLSFFWATVEFLFRNKRIQNLNTY